MKYEKVVLQIAEQSEEVPKLSTPPRQPRTTYSQQAKDFNTDNSIRIGHVSTCVMQVLFRRNKSQLRLWLNLLYTC